MSIESATDRAAFLADDGKVATYTLAAGGVSTLTGLYDAPTGDELGFSHAPAMLERRVQLVVRSADLPSGAAQGDAVSIAGVSGSFTVAALYPDGTGMTRLDLASA